MEKQDAFQGLFHIVIWNGDQHDHLIVLNVNFIIFIMFINITHRQFNLVKNEKKYKLSTLPLASHCIAVHNLLFYSFDLTYNNNN